MPYRFATQPQNYADYSSGRVFYSLPGHTAFPVRLASEIFQRCMATRESGGAMGPCLIYDPCCGGAYHLSTLAYLHWHAIQEIIGSDVDQEALSLAERNLSLLTIEGLDRRIVELDQALTAYGKPSHAAALKSARALRSRLLELARTHQVRSHLFRADAMDGDDLCERLNGRAIDLVITDVPYGQRSNWHIRGAAVVPALSPAHQVLEALLPVVSSRTVIAVAADKRQKIGHEGYRRIERFRVGRRQIVLLRPAGHAMVHG